jgi:hypothetical protein
MAMRYSRLVGVVVAASIITCLSTCGRPSAAAPAHGVPGDAGPSTDGIVPVDARSAAKGSAAAAGDQNGSGATIVVEKDRDRDPSISRTPTWLDVKLPPPPRAGVARGRAEISLDDEAHLDASEYAGVRVRVGNAEPRLIPVGQRVKLTVPASTTEPLHIEVAGIPMLAFVRPGETVSIIDGHDGGWWALLNQRLTENAPSKITICSDKGTDIECPAGYIWTYAYRGDRVCRVSVDEGYAAKCVKAPIVRVRGPFEGRAETAVGGELVPLTTGPLDAKTVGPWHPLDLGRERMAWVRLGDAEAILVLGPGEACEVWLDDQKRVAARLVKAPMEPKPQALPRRSR